MALRRPLVLVNGQLKELPIGDTLPGAGGGASSYYEGPTAPDPGEFPIWGNTTAGAILFWMDGAWVESGVNFLPSGGTVGQMVVKASGADFDYALVDPPAPQAQEVFVQGAQPADTGSPYLWVQTDLPNGGWTLWFNNDGTT